MDELTRSVLELKNNLNLLKNHSPAPLTLCEVADKIYALETDNPDLAVLLYGIRKLHTETVELLYYGQTKGNLIDKIEILHYDLKNAALPLHPIFSERIKNLQKLLDDPNHPALTSTLQLYQTLMAW